MNLLLDNKQIFIWILYFFIYAFIGWLLEVVYHVVKQGKFVNRGMLAGVICPIYGFGSVVLAYILFPLKDNLLILFFGSAFICTFLEYIAGFILDKCFHKRWWDYSDNKFNLGGYVCLEFLLYWGAGGLILIRDVHSSIVNVVSLIPFKLLIGLDIVFVIIFIVDFISTVQAILKFNKKLKLLSEMREDLYKISDKVGAEVADRTLNVMDKAELLSKFTARERRIFRAFPSMREKRYIEAFSELRERFEEWQSKQKNRHKLGEK